MTQVYDTINRPGGSVEAPFASVKTPRRVPLSAGAPGTLSHRWTNDPDGEAYCVDCLQTWRSEPDTGSPCDSERPICESCRQHPSSIWLYGFAVCGPCASAGVNP